MQCLNFRTRFTIGRYTEENHENPQSEQADRQWSESRAYKYKSRAYRFSKLTDSGTAIVAFRVWYAGNPNQAKLIRTTHSYHIFLRYVLILVLSTHLSPRTPKWPQPLGSQLQFSAFIISPRRANPYHPHWFGHNIWRWIQIMKLLCEIWVYAGCRVRRGPSVFWDTALCNLI
jgi:hypothetical protein